MASKESIEKRIQSIHTMFPFYDVVPHLIYIANRQGHIVHVNEAFANFSKKAEDDLQLDETGLGWLRNVHPEDVPSTLERWNYALEHGTPYENVYRLLDASGNYVWFITRALKTDMFGSEYEWIGTCTDISEQMKLTESLKETTVLLAREQKLLSTVINQLPVAVAIGEFPSGKVILSNQMMENVWRRPTPSTLDVSEYTKWIGFHPDGRRYEPEEWPLARSIQRGSIVVNEILEIMKGDGTRGIVSMSSTPVYDEHQNIMAAIVITQDIQDKVILEKEKVEALNAAQAAMEANKLKSTFLANMSHDIRTPMNGIIGSTQLLQDTQLTVEQKEYIDIIVICGRALLSLINDILDLSKIEAGRMELENAVFSLDEMIEGLLQMTNASLLTTGKTLNVNVNKVHLPRYVKGDRKRLEQVITNLLSNAIKFTPENGNIWIHLEAKSSNQQCVELHCSVQDTGIGISEENQKKLFSAFVQADLSTTRKYGGTGLGLSICKDLVKLMHGEIWVKSKVGEGSTFGFKIPLDILTTEEISTLEKKETVVTHVASRKERNSKRILFAEDNRINAQLALKIFTSAGYTNVDHASNGKIALDLYTKNANYDLILMDCQMPIMDGFQASKKLRDLGVDVPIIAFTASVTKEDKLKCIECGMDDIVMKPYDRSILLAKMDTWIEDTQRERNLSSAEIVDPVATGNMRLVTGNNHTT
jgi:signal transduction histidine kinase/CheY-like chemotaxis protein